MPKLTKRLIDAQATPEKSLLLWDSELRGFALRIQPSGVKTYFVNYRTAAGRMRRLSLGALTVDEARARARKILVDVAAGADPVAEKETRRAAPTLSEFLDRHVKEHVEAHNAPRTQVEAKDVFDRLVRPRLGALKLESVTRQDVARLHFELRSTPTQANRMLSFLSKAFANAELWGLRPEGANPCRKIKRYPEHARERFLSAQELARLGAALEEAETEGLPWELDPEKPLSKHTAKEENRRTFLAPEALAVIRVLLFTGARRGEIVSLAWEHVKFDLGVVDLPEKKGGTRKAHPVSVAALELLAAQPRVDGSPWVFPRRADPARHISAEVVETAWQRVRSRAGLNDVHLHDLRHTVGTYAAQSGANAFAIRDLLRHKTMAMTGRYANFDASPVRAVSDVIGERIAAGLAGVVKKSKD
ncbi:tyrosine-type recombinase/integrase [Methylocella sp.]|uniref:tyrosine-type recombinase/integrase n=1 Tax=Methylocella sp. TaxID=1978226 RepID=UPI003783DB6A